MTYDNLVKQRIEREIAAYLADMNDYEDKPDTCSIEQRLRDFVLYVDAKNQGQFLKYRHY